MANGQTSTVQGYGENQLYLRVGIPMKLAQEIGLEVGSIVIWRKDNGRGKNTLCMSKLEV